MRCFRAVPICESRVSAIASYNQWISTNTKDLPWFYMIAYNTDYEEFACLACHPYTVFLTFDFNPHTRSTHHATQALFRPFQSPPSWQPHKHSSGNYLQSTQFPVWLLGFVHPKSNGFIHYEYLKAGSWLCFFLFSRGWSHPPDWSPGSMSL